MNCPHGYATRMACSECMMDGPVATPRPAPEQLLHAERVFVATRESRCARRWEHRVERGDLIGYVTDVGWCCRECAR